MVWIVVATVVVVCLLNVVFMIYTKKKYEKKLADYQDKIVNRQIEEVKDIFMTMRGWRHDYHNHLQNLKAQLTMNRLSEMKAYLDELEGDLDNIQVKYNTGDINLDAILNSKLSIAEKDDIEINCKTEIAGELSIEKTDLCVLIGNLIDNGVEACQKLKKGEKRFLRIYICTRKDQLYISVTNATNETVRKLDQEYITNKRGNHGHGLKRINLIVEKYQGYITRANEPGVFVTQILLPLF